MGVGTAATINMEKIFPDIEVNIEVNECVSSDKETFSMAVLAPVLKIYDLYGYIIGCKNVNVQNSEH
jgi:hypothetical protein